MYVCAYGSRVFAGWLVCLLIVVLVCCVCCLFVFSTFPVSVCCCSVSLSCWHDAETPIKNILWLAGPVLWFAGAGVSLGSSWFGFWF